MSNEEKKDYERYLEEDTETWGEFFGNMKKYWKGFMADMREDMEETFAGLDEATSDLADYTDDPEMMDIAVTAGRVKTLAQVSESAMNAIGNCLDAASSIFNKDSEPAEKVSFKRGDHLYIRKGLKTYHAIYVGDRNIVYYSKGIDMEPQVKKLPFGNFAKKGKVMLVPQDEDISPKYTSEVIVKRALSRLGEDEFRNSESFVQWCRCGG